jgi:hypothetical protein
MYEGRSACINFSIDGLKQQSLIIVYRYQLRKTNFYLPFPFAVNTRKFAVSFFGLQQTNGSCHFLLVPFSIYIYIHIYIHTYIYIYIYIYMEKGIICLYICCRFKWKMDAQANVQRANGRLSFVRFLRRNKRKLSVGKLTRRTKRTKRNLLAHLWVSPIFRAF